MAGTALCRSAREIYQSQLDDFVGARGCLDTAQVNHGCVPVVPFCKDYARRARLSGRHNSTVNGIEMELLVGETNPVPFNNSF